MNLHKLIRRNIKEMKKALRKVERMNTRLRELEVVAMQPLGLDLLVNYIQAHQAGEPVWVRPALTSIIHDKRWRLLSEVVATSGITTWEWSEPGWQYSLVDPAVLNMTLTSLLDVNSIPL